MSGKTKEEHTKSGNKKKPKEKPERFCMDIVTDGVNISKHGELIKNFVSKLYTNAKYDDHLTEDQINVSIDTSDKRVCVRPTKVNNAVYVQLESIHSQLKDRHLTVNNSIKLGRPIADTLIHHTDVKIDVPEGLKWVTLTHRGPYIAWLLEPYVPHGAPLIYDGKAYKLTPKEEEVAGFYAKRLITDEKVVKKQSEDDVFNKNFWSDFRSDYLTSEHKAVFKDFKKANFSKIVSKIKELKESETAEQKRAKKRLADEKKLNYGYAYVNGVKEEIGNWTIEPASIFIGRGNNKLRGKIKRNIRPDEITINIGKEAEVPIPPSGGGVKAKWAGVVHEKDAEWIMKWKEPLVSETKYVRMGRKGQFKSNSDEAKYEKARKLNKYIDTVRKGYQQSINSSDIVEAQLGTVLYLIDNFGLRVGGEKGKDKDNDTVGASTLEVGNITLTSPDKINLDFLGKDSIEFKKTLVVPKNVFDNIKQYIKGKKANQQLFSAIGACQINAYLKSFDKDISAKVFRTRLASSLMSKALVGQAKNLTSKSTPAEKKKAFNNANIEVATVLNHRRTATKASEDNVKKYQEELTKLKDELKVAKKEGKNTKTLEGKIIKKKDQIEAKESTLELAVTTSRTNYIDPRIAFSWAKAHDLPVTPNVYTKTLYNTFKWADSTPEDWSYEKTPLESGFEQLEPSDNAECKIKGKTAIVSKKDVKSHKKINTEKSEESDESEESTYIQKHDLLMSRYKKLLQTCGYAAVKIDGNVMIQRIAPPTTKMSDPNTYAEIYEVSKRLKEDGSVILAYLLLDELTCRDVKNHVTIKRALKTSGYVDKYKRLVAKL
jgi:DNA topoisomerase I